MSTTRRRPGFDLWFALQGQGYYFDPEVNENGRRHKIEGYTTDIFTERAVRFLRERHEKPFVLFLAHKAVHPNIFQNADGSPRGPRTGANQFTPAERHRKLYEGKVVPRRPNAASYSETKPALRRAIPGLPPLGPTTGTDDATILNRLRLLAAADDGLGEILRTLEGTGQLDRTVVVVSSDHGYFYGEHGLDRKRRLAYEESMRIPLLVRYPPLIRAGTEVEAYALTVDHAPTLLELAGVSPPAGGHGRSLVPVLRPGARTPDNWTKSFLIEYYSDTVQPRLVRMGYKAVRTTRWKYIEYTELEGMNELYDLKRDPYEITNIIDQPAAANPLGEMRQELRRLLHQTSPVSY